MFAIGRNITGIKTSVAVWAEGDHEGTGRGAWIVGIQPEFRAASIQPPIGGMVRGYVHARRGSRVVPRSRTVSLDCQLNLHRAGQNFPTPARNQ